MTDRDLVELLAAASAIETKSEHVFRQSGSVNERANAEATFRLARPMRQSLEKWINARAIRAAQ